MARARNIKPGFFKNDQLAECSPLARLLFAGLWCESDREGRLEDRPKRLKAEYLPYDDCDIDALLGQLVARGFIVRYRAGGVGYIAVSKFAVHQNPHMREPASSIPAPDEHSASTVQAPDEHSSGPADSPSLIPDSTSLRSGEARKRATPPSRPDDVDESTWADWLALRKAKRAPVTDTVLREAEREAAKAGMPLSRFLEIWCARGSQGLQAEWLRPDERARAGPVGAAPPSKTLTAIQKLQALKTDERDVDSQRNHGRAEPLALPGP